MFLTRGYFTFCPGSEKVKPAAINSRFTRVCFFTVRAVKAIGFVRRRTLKSFDFFQTRADRKSVVPPYKFCGKAPVYSAEDGVLDMGGFSAFIFLNSAFHIGKNSSAYIRICCKATVL